MSTTIDLGYVIGPQGATGQQGAAGPKGEQGDPAKVNGITPDEHGSIVLTASDVGAAPAGYGLGDISGKVISTQEELDAAIQNGWYLITNTTISPTGYQSLMFVNGRRSDMANFQTVYPLSGGMQGIELRRYSVSGVWQPWEYVNPPLTIGVEYRTTERYQFKPVYVKTVNFGAMPDNTTKIVSIGDDTCRAVSVFGISSYGACICGTDAEHGAVLWAKNNQVKMKTTTDQSAYTLTAVVRYTKTTD